MDEKLLEISEEAIIRYFTTLAQFGYKGYNAVSKLLVLFYIEEAMLNEFSGFITEADYRVIINALYCLMGSTCMIDFPIFETYDSLIHEIIVNQTPRITEDSILRVSESDQLTIRVQA